MNIPEQLKKKVGDKARYINGSCFAEVDGFTREEWDVLRQLVTMTGNTRYWVLGCAAWPMGIDFPTLQEALGHISKHGGRLASWIEQANRVDYTDAQLDDLLLALNNKEL